MEKHIDPETGESKEITPEIEAARARMYEELGCDPEHKAFVESGFEEAKALGYF